MRATETIALKADLPATKLKTFLTITHDTGHLMNVYYFGARYYDPELGLWVSKDPAGQDFNLYGYCNGRVITCIDEDGRVWHILIGAVIGGIAGYVSYGISNGEWTGRAFVYAGIGAGAGALAAATGGAGVAILGTQAGLGSAILGGMISGMASGAFTGAATYFENAMYGKNGYSISNLDNSSLALDPMAWLYPTIQGAVIGGATGMVSGAIGYGVKNLIDEGWQRYMSTKFSDPTSLNDFDKFALNKKIVPEKVGEWKYLPSDKNTTVIQGKKLDDWLYRTKQKNWLLDFVSESGTGKGEKYRFEGSGLHAKEEWGGVYLHYDSFNPMVSFGQFFAHAAVETYFYQTTAALSSQITTTYFGTIGWEKW